MSPKGQGGLTVLVVEDEWLARDMISRFLEAEGCHVMEARDGETAVNLLHSNAGIDVVFTDINLARQLTGWDVGEASREVDPEMAVIYTSGGNTISDRRVGGSLFFEKPYDPAQVLEAFGSLRSDMKSK